MSFPVRFRWNLNPKKNPKKFEFTQFYCFGNFRGSHLAYFWAITRIIAIIAIFKPFGTPAPRLSATVKMLIDLTFHWLEVGSISDYEKVARKVKFWFTVLYEWNDCIAFEVSWKRILYLKPYILSWTYRGYVSDSGFNISILESVK